MAKVLLTTLASVTAAIASLLTAGAAPAQTTTWKANSPFVEGREEVKALQKWADLVSEKSGGRLKISVFAGSSLGVKDADMLRVLPDGGVIQVAHLYPGYLTRDVPEIATTVPPGVIGRPEKLVELAPILTKIYNDIYDKHGLKLIGYTYQPVQTTSVFCKTPINTLAALKGKKLRVWEKHHADTFAKLGVAAQVIPQGELYLALQTGVIDCAVYNVGYARTISIQEVAPYEAYLFPYVTHPVGIVVAKKAWDALPADIQQTALAVAQQVEKETLDVFLQGKFDTAAREALVPMGLKPLEAFPRADQEAFRKAAQVTWEELSAQAGKNAIENKKLVMQVASE